MTAVFESCPTLPQAHFKRGPSVLQLYHKHISNAGQVYCNCTANTLQARAKCNASNRQVFPEVCKHFSKGGTACTASIFPRVGPRVLQAFFQGWDRVYCKAFFRPGQTALQASLTMGKGPQSILQTWAKCTASISDCEEGPTNCLGSSAASACIFFSGPAEVTAEGPAPAPTDLSPLWHCCQHPGEQYWKAAPLRHQSIQSS
jgi:hypothetical protein